VVDDLGLVDRVFKGWQNLNGRECVFQKLQPLVW